MHIAVARLDDSAQFLDDRLEEGLPIAWLKRPGRELRRRQPGNALPFVARN
jgi:hypothetical protein